MKAFARCLVDKRARGVVGQRLFGIACGHPDGNDAERLADDPMHKLLVGRDPVTAARVASTAASVPPGPFLVRLDGGFATPEVFDFLEAEQVDSVVAIAGMPCCCGRPTSPCRWPVR